MIAILTSRLSTEFLESVREFSRNNTCCIFTNAVFPPSEPPVSIFHSARAYSFEGSIISTDLATTSTLTRLQLPAKKMFYVAKMEWLEMDSVHYSQMRNLYQNDEIDLIASTQKIYDKLESIFKKPLCIMKDWNLNHIKQVIENEY